MKSLMLVVVAWCVYGSAFAQERQDSTSVYAPIDQVIGVPPPEASEKPRRIVLSDPPSTQELVDLIVDAGGGVIDPFIAIQAITSKGENAVPGLAEILFSDSLFSTPVVAESDSGKTSSGGTQPRKILALFALEAIGTMDAYNAIIRSAIERAEIEIKGAALRAMGGSYYERALEDSTLVPDIGLLHILLMNVDDTTKVEQSLEPLGAIARRGFRRLTGLDLGDLSDSSKEILIDGRLTPLADYREAQWEKIRETLDWSKTEGRFLTHTK